MREPGVFKIFQMGYGVGWNGARNFFVTMTKKNFLSKTKKKKGCSRGTISMLQDVSVSCPY